MSEIRLPLRLGGMALRNGLLIVGPTAFAVAIRCPDGSLAVASGPRPTTPERLLGIPLVRGVGRLAEMIAVIPVAKRALPAAQLAFESPLLAFSIGAGSVASAGLRRAPIGPLASEATVAALAVLPALLSLRSPDLTRYHGAEHKVIGAYESGSDAAAAAKEHERCGSHLLTPMMLASVCGNVLARRAPAGTRGGAHAVASLAAAGIAVEVFGWLGRHRTSAIARVAQAPGFALQRVLATREPADAELEVARAALETVLALEGAPG